ncbi:MAG: hypothetical protein V3V72_00935 [Ignavibacteriaceae bacterium]
MIPQSSTFLNTFITSPSSFIVSSTFFTLILKISQPPSPPDLSGYGGGGQASIQSYIHSILQSNIDHLHSIPLHSIER